MQIRKDRWHYSLYTSYFQLFADKERSVPGANLCTYVRRATIGLLKLIGAVTLIGVVFAFTTILLLVANVLTILLGFGIAGPSRPGKDEIIRIPFRVKQRSFAWFAIPFWMLAVLIVTLWFGFSTDPDGTFGILAATGKVVGWIFVAIASLLFFEYLPKAKEKFLEQNAEGPVADGLRLIREYYKAKKARICPLLEFVDPPGKQPPER